MRDFEHFVRQFLWYIVYISALFMFFLTILLIYAMLKVYN